MSIDVSGGRTSGLPFITNQFDDKQGIRNTISLFFQVFFGALLGYTVSGLNENITNKLKGPIGIFVIVFININYIVSRPRVLNDQNYYLYLTVISALLSATIWLSVAMLNQLDDKMFNKEDEKIIIVKR